jgi:hypothetical protein
MSARSACGVWKNSKNSSTVMLPPRLRSQEKLKSADEFTSRVSLRSMWCLACGGEMQLLEVVQAHAMLIEGYEHHTWRCSACGQTERRLVFIRREPNRSDARQPAEPEPNEKANPTNWARMVDKVRDRQRRLVQEAAVARERDRLVELAGLGKARPRRAERQSSRPAEPGSVEPDSPSHPAGVSGPAFTEPPAPLLERLRNRQASAVSHLPFAKLLPDIRDFDRVWDGLPDAEAPIPDPSPAPLLEPLPRSVSLVPVEAQAKSAAARALALLTGWFQRPRHG